MHDVPLTPHVLFARNKRSDTSFSAHEAKLRKDARLVTLQSHDLRALDAHKSFHCQITVVLSQPLAGQRMGGKMWEDAKVRLRLTDFHLFFAGRAPSDIEGKQV